MDCRGGGPKAEAGFSPPGVKDAKLSVPRPSLWSGPRLRAAPASARRLVHSRGKGVEANGLGAGVMVGSAVSFISLHNQTRPDGSDLASPQRLREELRSFQRKRASFSSRSGRGHPGGAQGKAGSGGGV